MRRLDIRKAVVLGAGVMGASIAAHLAGNGMMVYLLDMAANDGGDRSRLANEAKKRLMNPKTRLLYAKEAADRIVTGNLEDDIGRVADADWVIEAIVESLEPKINLFAKVSELAGDGCILSSNTSGISINAIARGISASHRGRFLGTHFFNPPRYMELLELIPAAETDPALMQAFAAFAEKRLGKSVVVANDTPNFIANRIGVANTSYVLHGLEQYDISTAAADYLTGRLIGRPPAGTLRTCDLVGFDIVRATTTANYGAETVAEEREVMTLPAYFVRMMESGAMGDKVGKGFFAKGSKREPLMWDRNKEEYVPRVLELPPVLEEKNPMKDKVLAVLDSETPEGDYLWYVLKGVFTYSANRVPEITEDFRKIDLAMRLGYNWTYGPFQLWEALGTDEIIRRLEGDGIRLPEWVEAHLKANGRKFYTGEGFGALLPRHLSAGDTALPVLWESEDVVLKDLGDGIGGIVLITPRSTINDRAAANIIKAVEAAQELCRGAVITSQGKHFCVGADLQGILEYIDRQEWDILEESVARFQAMTKAVKYASIPIVAAAFGSVMGGGAEICLHAHKVVACNETYIGLVEPQAGLVPAGGGLKELAQRCGAAAKYTPGLFTLPIVKQYAAMVSGCKVSSSALHGVELGLLAPTDRLVLHRDHLLEAAKEEALALACSYIPAVPEYVPVFGVTGYAAVMMGINDQVRGGFATEYDGVIAGHVAAVLTGGGVPDGTVLDEEELLRLEREAFVSLCRQPRTRERIAGFLSTGRPVRN